MRSGLAEEVFGCTIAARIVRQCFPKVTIVTGLYDIRLLRGGQKRTALEDAASSEASVTSMSSSSAHSSRTAADPPLGSGFGPPTVLDAFTLSAYKVYA